jgi:adenylate cyclase
MAKKGTNHWIALVISLTLFVLFSLIYEKTQLFDGLENTAIDHRYYLRDPNELSEKIQEGVRREKINPRVNTDIIIVAIDNDTITELDAQGITWPIPWKIHSTVTDYLASGKPNSIVFDVMFLDNKPGESELAEAFRRAGNVIVDYPFEKKELTSRHRDYQERMAILRQNSLPAHPSDRESEWVLDVVPPTAVISSAVKGAGFANINPDMDGKNRMMPLYIKYQGRYYPSIDLQIVLSYYGITLNDVEIIPGRHVKLRNVNQAKLKKPSKDGSVTIPIDTRGFMDINFAGGHGSFSNYSYFYFNRDGAEPENSSFKDKIMLIAAYSSTGIAEDIHKSPYGDFFGIEHHANAVNTIINQDFIYKLSSLWNIMIFFVVSLILGILIPRMSIIAGTVFTFLLSLGYMIFAFYLFDSRSVIYVFYTPIIQIALNFTLIAVYRQLTEQKEKRFIRQTFSKFVSKAVVDELLRNPEKLKLGGEKKILSVLFSDIRGFTSISEAMPPEKMVEHLNEYLQAMTNIVYQFDGTLDKYVGDEIMAFWGAPIPQEDHALRACRGALEMIASLDQLNREWEARGKTRLDIGIGVNTGEMIVGNMGSTSRMDYTLMGDMVNLGARLEGTNKVYGTKIIISEFTYEHVKDRIIARELDLIRVKGKAHPVKIYELIDVIDGHQNA